MIATAREGGDGQRLGWAPELLPLPNRPTARSVWWGGINLQFARLCIHPARMAVSPTHLSLFLGWHTPQRLRPLHMHGPVFFTTFKSKCCSTSSSHSLRSC